MRKFLRPCQLGRRLPAYGCHAFALSPALLLTGVLRLPPGLQLSFFDAEVAEILARQEPAHLVIDAFTRGLLAAHDLVFL